MDALDIYFEEMGKAAGSGLFDVIAHPDYFRKYLGLTHEMPVSFEEYGSKVLDTFEIFSSNFLFIIIIGRYLCYKDAFLRRLPECSQSLCFLVQ